jgi:hypothetical protein
MSGHKKGKRLASVAAPGASLGEGRPRALARGRPLLCCAVSKKCKGYQCVMSRGRLRSGLFFLAGLPWYFSPRTPAPPSRKARGGRVPGEGVSGGHGQQGGDGHCVGLGRRIPRQEETPTPTSRVPTGAAMS